MGISKPRQISLYKRLTHVHQKCCHLFYYTMTIIMRLSFMEESVHIQKLKQQILRVFQVTENSLILKRHKSQTEMDNG